MSSERRLIAAAGLAALVGFIGGLVFAPQRVDAKIAAGTIQASNIAAGAITSTQLAANSVIAGKVAAGAITATELSVSQLSAITSNLGNVTAGSIAISGSGQSFSVSSTGFLDVYSSEHDLIHVNTQLVNDGFLQVGGNITQTSRTGDASGYVCYDANGTLFRSESGC